MQVERREAWSSRHADSQDSCPVQRSRDAAGALRWLQCAAGVASLPADIPFVFRHWSADDASPWHQYMLQYRTEYTYRRLGVQRGTQTSTRVPLRDVSARYSADSVTDGETSTTCQQRTQSEPAVKSQGRKGHRSAPASFVHVNTGRQHGRVVDDEDNVTITTVSLQLPPPHCTIDHQLPAAKSVLRCPAIRIHLNSSSGSSSAAAAGPSQLPASLPPAISAATSNVLPRVITDCSSTDSRTQQQQHPVSSSLASDSHFTFSGRTMRNVPSNGFSIDDRTMLVTCLPLRFTCTIYAVCVPIIY